MIFTTPLWFGEEVRKRDFRGVDLKIQTISVEDGRCFVIFCSVVGKTNDETLFLMERRLKVHVQGVNIDSGVVLSEITGIKIVVRGVPLDVKNIVREFLKVRDG